MSEERSSADKPPILGSWRNVYAAVLLILALWISLFYWITRTYNAPQTSSANAVHASPDA